MIERPFKTWDSFVQSREPYGLGMQAAVAHAIMNEKDDGKLLRDVLGKHGRPKKGEEKGDNITLKGRGTSRAYILARLQRDRPDLAAKVEAGKLSARAAGIAAGFIDPSPTPVERALKVLPKLTRMQLRHLRARIDAMLSETSGKRAA